MAQSIFFGRVLSIIGINCLKSNPTPFDNQPKIPYLRPQTKTTCQMLLYRQLWKNLTQTANRLTQQLVVVAYSTVNQVITPPLKKNKQRISHFQQLCIQKLAAWLSSSKNLCHAIKAFHKYHTNKTIFLLGKNDFISFGYQALL
jgi:hypothetical protein